MLSACALTAVQAQALFQPNTCPVRTIRLVVLFPPCGGTDILSRLVANKLTEVSRWRGIADNRSGTIGIAEVVRAQPTGYDRVRGQKDKLVVAPWRYKA